MAARHGYTDLTINNTGIVLIKELFYTLTISFIGTKPTTLGLVASAEDAPDPFYAPHWADVTGYEDLVIAKWYRVDLPGLSLGVKSTGGVPNFIVRYG